ncbi:DUF1330 domain-containing protein [Thermodesulfobacteriota bacterium]|jgi:uncharacterized protein (DUF1330 family)
MAAYLVGHITVRDPDLWQVYTTGVQKSLIPFEANLVFRGQRAAVLAGEHSYEQCVVIEFLDQGSLQEWFNSDAYQDLIPTRNKAADVVIISYDT